MGTFLAGLGIATVIFFVMFGTVVAFAMLIATIRAAINDRLGNFSKIAWILANLFIPGAAFLYFAFMDRNGFLKFVGWVCIVSVILAGVLGGSALWAGVEGLKNYNWSVQVLPDPSNKPSETPAESVNENSIEL